MSDGWKRREIFALTYHFWVDCLLFLLGWFLPIFLFFTLQWHLLFFYILWRIYDRTSPSRGGRPSEWYQKWRLHRWLANYFPVTLHKTVNLSPDKNYIFAIHPHGVMATSAYINFATDGTKVSEKFPGLKFSLTTHYLNFLTPVRREILLASGLIDISAESINYVLTKMDKGRAVVVAVGGGEETLDDPPGGSKLTLAMRKGFIREAIKAGAALVPVYSFGEDELYDQINHGKLRKFQEIFRHFTAIPLWLYHGRGLIQKNFGLLPYRKAIQTVVGEPIPVTKNSHPSPGEIIHLHAQYKIALKRLFDENKERFGMKEDDQLKYKCLDFVENMFKYDKPDRSAYKRRKQRSEKTTVLYSTHPCVYLT